MFVSSHLLAEVEQVCTHVGVMRTGKLVYQGPLADLRGQARLLVRTPKPDHAATVLRDLGLVELEGEDGETWFAKLTASGVDVVEYNFPSPAGVARPRKYW